MGSEMDDRVNKRYKGKDCVSAMEEEIRNLPGSFVNISLFLFLGFVGLPDAPPAKQVMHPCELCCCE